MNWQEASRSATIIKKVSIKAVFGKVAEIREICEKAKKGEGEKAKYLPVHMMRLTGTVTGIRQGEGANGPWTGFSGEFLAISGRDRTAWRGSQAFPPEVVTDLIKQAYQHVDDGSTLSIGFDVFATFDESAITGYVYSAQALLEPQESDPLVMLGESIKADLPPLLEAAPTSSTPSTSSTPLTAKKKEG